ncbi:tyrosine-type recombinase/integrase [Roseibium sp. M-1]
MKTPKTRSTMPSASRKKIPFKYCSADADRHGNVRIYLRRPGLPKYRMQASYLDENGNITEAFAAEYHRVMAGNAKQSTYAEHRAWKPGSIGWLFDQYQRSKTFQQQDQATQRDKHSVLGRYCAAVGHHPFQKLRKSDVEASQMKRRETPAAADKLVKYLKALFNWALNDLDLMARFPLPRNPAEGVSKISRSDGFHTWSASEIATFREHYPLGTTARLAFELLYNLGIRRSDLVQLGPGNLDGDTIKLVPQKGSKNELLVLPIAKALAEALRHDPQDQETFLMTEYGKPFSSNGFGNKMRDWCDTAGLKQCSSHGLRKSAATVLAEAGATEYQLMAVFGWSDSKTARIYTKKAEQQRLARSAFAHLENTSEPINVPLSSTVKSSGTKRGKNAGKPTPRKGSGGPGGPSQTEENQ